MRSLPSRRAFAVGVLVYAVLALLALDVGRADAVSVTRKHEARWVKKHPGYLGTGGGGKLHVQAPATADGDTCFTIGFPYRFREQLFPLVWVTAWHFAPHYRWCVADGKVVAYSHTINNAIRDWSWWDWSGYDERVSSGSSAYHYWRDKATYKVCATLLFLHVCFYRHPWVAMTVRADGSYWYENNLGDHSGHK